MCIVYSTIYRCWPPSYPGHYYAAAGAAGPSGGSHHLASPPAPSSNKPDPRYSPYILNMCISLSLATIFACINAIFQLLVYHAVIFINNFCPLLMCNNTARSQDKRQILKNITIALITLSKISTCKSINMDESITEQKYQYE